MKDENMPQNFAELDPSFVEGMVAVFAGYIRLKIHLMNDKLDRRDAEFVATFTDENGEPEPESMIRAVLSATFSLVSLGATIFKDFERGYPEEFLEFSPEKKLAEIQDKNSPKPKNVWGMMFGFYLGLDLGTYADMAVDSAMRKVIPGGEEDNLRNSSHRFLEKIVSVARDAGMIEFIREKIGSAEDLSAFDSFSKE